MVHSINGSEIIIPKKEELEKMKPEAIYLMAYKKGYGIGYNEGHQDAYRQQKGQYERNV